MTLTRDEAWQLLCQWTPSQALRRHALAVEAVMAAAAGRYGCGAAGEVERWALAGLLHDADYESWPDEHPRRIVAWLVERGDCDDIAHAISAHDSGWGVPHDSALDKALLACDELTGFIGACCHVRPGGLSTLAARSVVKKLQTRGFAAKVKRSEIQAGIARLGVELSEHIDFIVEALRPHTETLGLQGRPDTTD